MTNNIKELLYSSEISDVLLAYELYKASNTTKKKFSKFIIKEILKQPFVYADFMWFTYSKKYRKGNVIPQKSFTLSEIHKNINRINTYVKIYTLGCFQLFVRVRFGLNQYSSFNQDLTFIEESLHFEISDSTSGKILRKVNYKHSNITNVLNKFNHFFDSYEKSNDEDFCLNFKW